MSSHLLGSIALLLTATAQISVPAAESAWRNPQDSVHVRIYRCGQGMCGTVVWANEKAKADSARGGTPNLVGTQLFRDFRATGPNRWSGKIFVPDLNHVFTGTGTLIDANTLVARGCVAPNFGCKSQTWTRISNPPQ